MTDRRPVLLEGCLNLTLEAVGALNGDEGLERMREEYSERLKALTSLMEQLHEPEAEMVTDGAAGLQQDTAADGSPDDAEGEEGTSYNLEEEPGEENDEDEAAGSAPDKVKVLSSCAHLLEDLSEGFCEWFRESRAGRRAAMEALVSAAGLGAALHAAIESLVIEVYLTAGSGIRVDRHLMSAAAELRSRYVKKMEDAALKLENEIIFHAS